MGQSVEVFGLVVEVHEQESGLGSGNGAGEMGGKVWQWGGGGEEADAVMVSGNKARQNEHLPQPQLLSLFLKRQQCERKINYLRTCVLVQVS